jgi:AspT/YidE/YbjL antiporter-like protein
MLTRNICSEYGEYNIQCNGIGPGYIATPQTAPLREKQADGSRHPFDSFICAKTPAGRWLAPEELTGPAVFLASEASNAVNGHILYVDGGILAYIGKTGPILWSMSGPANQLLRQLGLLLFLAEVGTSAGRNLMATFQESGWLLFGVGAAITLVPMLVAAIVGLFVFKINILDLLGTITGGMTSTPGLAAADSMTDSNIPSVAYATVYPIAMVFLILIIQVIASAVY